MLLLLSFFELTCELLSFGQCLLQQVYHSPILVLVNGASLQQIRDLLQLRGSGCVAILRLLQDFVEFGRAVLLAKVDLALVVVPLVHKRLQSQIHVVGHLALGLRLLLARHHLLSDLALQRLYLAHRVVHELQVGCARLRFRPQLVELPLEVVQLFAGFCDLRLN
jgi:hypothetical protein